MGVYCDGEKQEAYRTDKERDQGSEGGGGNSRVGISGCVVKYMYAGCDECVMTDPFTSSFLLLLRTIPSYSVPPPFVVDNHICSSFLVLFFAALAKPPPLSSP